MDPTNEYRERLKRDPRTTDDLLAEATAAARYKSSEDDLLSDAYWEPIRVLHCRADDSVMTAATRLLSSRAAEDRALASDILSQVAFGDEARRTEVADVLLPAFQRENNCDVLGSMAYAFGHIGDARAIPRLVELSSHPDEEIRFAVGYGLTGQEDGRAVATLILLSTDPDVDVRNWATFGLGRQIESDTPEIREALVARLSDPDDETRQEALRGLALRGDTRVVLAFLEELESCSAEMLEDWYLIRDAAEAVVQIAQRHPAANWCLLLENLQALRLADPAELQKAIDACRNG